MTLDPVSNGDPHVPAHNAERDAINTLRTDVDKKIVLPNSPTLGSLLRWDGDNWLPTKMRLFEGNGSPEGVISAPVGSRYVDATAASGIAEWFKVSGAGNTGWSPQNTGIAWTNFSLGTGWVHESGNPAQACMVNGSVFHRGMVHRSSGAGVTVGTLPNGTFPPRPFYSMIRAGSVYVPLAISTNGIVSISGVVDNNTDVHIGSTAGTPYRLL